MTLLAPVDHELVIKKSRFLARVQPVKNRAEAQALVLHLKQAHPDAVHVCWAMLAGGDSAAQDDGEPSGTAGRPMLEVLRHQDLDGVVATVVRYFGGIKLGAGGLVRAYTDAVAQALLVAEKSPIVPKIELTCWVPYDMEGWLRRQAQMAEVSILSVSHESLVQFVLEIPKVQSVEWQQALNDLGQGKLVWADANTRSASQG
ncbi:IMPACT family member YigZ [Limnohabitans sp. 103DPR2]|nr:IMPACT family member YigZ [Limnohabitans sp. 103DPR2]